VFSEIFTPEKRPKQRRDTSKRKKTGGNIAESRRQDQPLLILQLDATMERKIQTIATMRGAVSRWILTRNLRWRWTWMWTWAERVRKSSTRRPQVKYQYRRKGTVRRRQRETLSHPRRMGTTSGGLANARNWTGETLAPVLLTMQPSR
jgi:hypothetical protein